MPSLKQLRKELEELEEKRVTLYLTYNLEDSLENILERSRLNEQITKLTQEVDRKENRRTNIYITIALTVAALLIALFSILFLTFATEVKRPLHVVLLGAGWCALTGLVTYLLIEEVCRLFREL